MIKIGKKVLVGGCFDVLHPGHIILLEKAKKLGQELIVLLESDRKVRQLKGVNRPVHNQKARAKILKALRCVDRVISLPFLPNDNKYVDLVKKIKPDIIAVTKGYGDTTAHRKIAKLIGADFKLVTSVVGNYSSTRIINWGLDKKSKS